MIIAGREYLTYAEAEAAIGVSRPTLNRLVARGVIEAYRPGKKTLLAACAGGSGNGAVECLGHMENYAQHMGLKLCDRLPVIRFNRGYMLPALKAAGAAFARRLGEEA